MIHYRPFRNSDPPKLAEIWSSQPPNRGLMQPMTAGMFDDLVLAQPYFDRRGLVVALQDDVPIGFAHAGFGSNAEGSGLDKQSGTISLLMVRPGFPVDEVGAGLIGACEDYLRGFGVRDIYGGATNRAAPFYLGLYGGCRLPGVLSSDTVQTGCFRRAGYEEATLCTVFEQQLAGFRPVMDRQLLQFRRQQPVMQKTPSRPVSWWDACLRPNWEVVQFEICGDEFGTNSAAFWDIEPLASSWGAHSMGLWELLLADRQERGLLMVYLLGEAMRALQAQGISLVEVQADADDRELHAACLRLGFREADRGIRFYRSD